MRLSPDEIKQLILHDDHEVRSMAVRHFRRSFSQDLAVMPLVIQAVEQYGREQCISMVSAADGLPQTNETLEWCHRELGNDDQDLENYPYLISRIVRQADAELLQPRESAFLSALGFEETLGESISERIRFQSMDPNQLWKQLEDFCEKERHKRYVTDVNLSHGYNLIEAISRDGEEFIDRVLSFLAEEIDDVEENPLTWMEGFMVRLAGEMRIHAAVPLVVDKLHIDADWLSEQCLEALAKIGTDAVVEEVATDYPLADFGYQIYASGILESIHTDECLKACLQLMEQEDDDDMKPHLGEAALLKFSSEAIEPVRQVLLHCTLNPEYLELRQSLLTVCTAMDIDMPEFDEWKAASKHDAELRRQMYADRHEAFDDDDDEDEFDELIGPPPNTIVREGQKIGRNDPCPCGSGKKYKKCCMNTGNPLWN